MENLPLEIISEIFSRLPIETLLQCKHVCETWRKLLDPVKLGSLIAIGSEDQKFKRDPQFEFNKVRLFYTEKAYDEIDLDGEVNVNKRYPGYQVCKFKRCCGTFGNWFNNDILVGSCNGLVCLATVLVIINEPIFVFNPLIPNECIILPPIRTRIINYDAVIVASGFGYVRATDEYKVVRILYSDNQPLYVGQVEVYTIGSGCGWRNKGEISYGLCDSPGVHVDGVLHWLEYRKEWKIVAFDLVAEEFRVLPSPPCFWLLSSCYNIGASNPFEFLEDTFELHVLGGLLCVIHKNKGERLDIWSLNKKDRKERISEWVWSKEFSMECLEKDHIYEPFAITKDNKLLLWFDKYILLCYDPKIAALSKLSDYEQVGKDVKYYQVIPHMKTSVSVVALEGKVQEISANQSKKEKISSADRELGRVTWIEPRVKSL